MIIVNAQSPDEAAAVTALLVRQDVLAYRVLVNGAEQPPPGEFERITSRLPGPEKNLDPRHAALRKVLRDADGPLSVRAVCVRLDVLGVPVPQNAAHRWLAADLSAGLVRRVVTGPEGGPPWQYEWAGEKP